MSLNAVGFTLVILNGFGFLPALVVTLMLGITLGFLFDAKSEKRVL